MTDLVAPTYDPGQHPPEPVRVLVGGESFLYGMAVGLFRIFHRDRRTPDGVTPRAYGPVQAGRFDPHEPDANGAAQLQDITVLYLAEAFETAVLEALAPLIEEDPLAGYFIEVCPNRMVTAIRPSTAELAVQDFVADSPATLGAPDDLGDGPWSRPGTQAWARAIRSDRPAGPQVAGIRYWSARHRAPDDSRDGINVASFDTSPELIVRAPGLGPDGTETYPVAEPRHFARIELLLERHGVSLGRVPAAECERCQQLGTPP